MVLIMNKPKLLDQVKQIIRTKNFAQKRKDA